METAAQMQLRCRILARNADHVPRREESLAKRAPVDLPEIARQPEIGEPGTRATLRIPCFRGFVLMCDVHGAPYSPSLVKGS